MDRWRAGRRRPAVSGVSAHFLHSGPTKADRLSGKAGVSGWILAAGWLCRVFGRRGSAAGCRQGLLSRSGSGGSIGLQPAEPCSRWREGMHGRREQQRPAAVMKALRTGREAGRLSVAGGVRWCHKGPRHALEMHPVAAPPANSAHRGSAVLDRYRGRHPARAFRECCLQKASTLRGVPGSTVQFIRPVEEASRTRCIPSPSWPDAVPPPNPAASTGTIAILRISPRITASFITPAVPI